jgi:hypothetical protein
MYYYLSNFKLHSAYDSDNYPTWIVLNYINIAQDSFNWVYFLEKKEKTPFRWKIILFLISCWSKSDASVRHIWYIQKTPYSAIK